MQAFVHARWVVAVTAAVHPHGGRAAGADAAVLEADEGVPAFEDDFVRREPDGDGELRVAVREGRVDRQVVVVVEDQRAVRRAAVARSVRLGAWRVEVRLAVVHSDGGEQVALEHVAHDGRGDAVVLGEVNDRLLVRVAVDGGEVTSLRDAVVLGLLLREPLRVEDVGRRQALAVVREAADVAVAVASLAGRIVPQAVRVHLDAVLGAGRAILAVRHALGAAAQRVAVAGITAARAAVVGGLAVAALPGRAEAHAVLVDAAEGALVRLLVAATVILSRLARLKSDKIDKESLSHHIQSFGSPGSVTIVVSETKRVQNGNASSLLQFP